MYHELEDIFEVSNISRMSIASAGRSRFNALLVGSDPDAMNLTYCLSKLSSAALDRAEDLRGTRFVRGDAELGLVQPAEVSF